MASRTGRSLHWRPIAFFEGVAEDLIGYAVTAFSARPGAALPDLPGCVAHVWAWFCELSAARTSNGWGANPITFPEIDAWARLTRSEPTPWEIGLIRRIDAAILPKINKTGSKQEIAATDAQGVASLFGGLKARAREVYK